MKTCGVNTYQSYNTNSQNNNQKSFMGHVYDVIDSTSKATGNISDLVVSTKNAISSPEETTINILNNQLEKNVVNNEKTPVWLRKIATYGSAALITTLTFIAGKKVLSTPGSIKNYLVRNLSKTENGTKIIKKLSAIKTSTVNAFNAVFKDNKAADFIKTKAANLFNSSKTFVSEKFPKVSNMIKSTSEKLKLDKLKDWTAGDYTKNVLAGIFGINAGKKFIAKYQDKFDATQNNKNIEATAEKEDCREAA